MGKAESQERRTRLPDLETPGYLTDPWGDILMRPWFDRVSLRWVGNWFLSLSRAWAVAIWARGDADRFRSALPEAEIPAAVLKRTLAYIDERRADYAHAHEHWQAAVFASTAPSDADLVEAELARQRTVHALSITRAAFLPWHLRQRIEGAKYRVPSVALVERQQGDRLAAPEKAFPARPADVETSHALAGPYGRVYWLRFQSPLGDTAWARVYEPEKVDNPPTLVFLHGISMEIESWKEQSDAVNELACQGIRVIRPEGPWHGRRRPDGQWGGEPVIARAPLGQIELMQHWPAEAASLIAWARARGSAHVALGGVSLGALTSQLSASAAWQWPEACRPDTLFLVGTSADMLETGLEGGLAKLMNLPEELRAAGWDHESLSRLRPLLEPGETPVVPAERIVMLLGSKDVVTPYGGGLELARRWGVKRGNQFHRNRGHFSVYIALGQDRAPLQRLAELLRD
ncbi:MAG: alpha/beta hydrolase family protein [Rhodovibrionaceae bacterium]|nr:alpha/beta hydrolase family protein [Rhodovibrionaceae bacterium]